MSDRREEVPKQFYRGDMAKPVAQTVGELIDELSRLPSDLPVDPYEDGVALTVYNIDMDAHLAFSEGCDELDRMEDDWEDD